MRLKILVTGALGQIGSELVPALQDRYGAENVIASDVRMPTKETAPAGQFEHLDCTKMQQSRDVVTPHGIGTIYHLTALLSATAEDRPQAAWHLNMGGLYRVLEVARQHECALFFPSSMGAFGPTTPRDNTPQDTIQRPTTMYGVAKVARRIKGTHQRYKHFVDYGDAEGFQQGLEEFRQQLHKCKQCRAGRN